MSHLFMPPASDADQSGLWIVLEQLAGEAPEHAGEFLVLLRRPPVQQFGKGLPARGDEPAYRFVTIRREGERRGAVFAPDEEPCFLEPLEVG